MLLAIAFAKSSLGDFNVEIDLEMAYDAQIQSTKMNRVLGCGENLDNCSTLGIRPYITNRLCS